MAGLTPAERGRMGGAPITSGSVRNTYGGHKSSIHVTRLRKLAGSLSGRERDHVQAAIECIQSLTTHNRRLGAQVGATQRRAALSHRGLFLSGPLEAIAVEIAELAGHTPVVVYRFKRRFRVTAGREYPQGAPGLIGRYDHGCDVRLVLDDLRTTTPEARHG